MDNFSGLVRYLRAIFNRIESLVITSFNLHSDFFNASFKNFTTINHLEIKLPASEDFGLDLPIRLKTVVIDIQKSESFEERYRKKQLISASYCTLLTTVDIRKNVYDPHGIIFVFEPPTCIQNLIFDADKFCTFKSDVIWTFNLRIIHFSSSHKFPFIAKPDIKDIRKLDEKMCPNCIELGMILGDGEVRIIWKK